MTIISSLSLKFIAIAFSWNSIVVSAFVGLVSTSGGRKIVAETLKLPEICLMSLAPDEVKIPDNLMEELWRYAKKPLLSVGGKGATTKHGNSLRQLLDDHTVVKVKVNTKSFGTLENAYESLRILTIESGASNDIELIQMREKDRTILFGLPGTLQSVENGRFPPATPADDETVV